eukprot:3925054-Amphidinium_carterae.2
MEAQVNMPSRDLQQQHGMPLRYSQHQMTATHSGHQPPALHIYRLSAWHTILSQPSPFHTLLSQSRVPSKKSRASDKGCKVEPQQPRVSILNVVFLVDSGTVIPGHAPQQQVPQH